jgi:hypothetical protein
MNSRFNRTVWFLLTVVLLAASGLFQEALAQATNGTLTNLPPTVPANPLPTGKDAAWFALIPLVTFGLAWIFGKIRTLPKQLIPLIVPILGWLVGFAIEKATAANFPWWSTTGAGALATWLYEAVKGLSNAGPESALTPTPGPNDSSPVINRT